MNGTLEDVEQTVLTAVHRCDASCPAQAKVRLKIAGSNLELCAHHYNKSEPKLSSFVEIDERWSLVKKPS